MKLFLENDTEVTSENPITVSLRSDQSQVQAQRVYISTEDSYENVVVSPTGGNASEWSFAPDNNGNPGAYGAYGSDLNIGDISNEDIFFWVRRRSNPEETPQFDDSVLVVLTGDLLQGPQTAPIIDEENITITLTTATIPHSTVEDATGYRRELDGVTADYAEPPLILDTLQPGETYNYRIKALQNGEEGPWTDMQSLTTPEFVEDEEFDLGEITI
jgi:hypothetical protein